MLDKEQTILNILEVIKNEDYITQKIIAQHLGIGVTSVNRYVNQCIKDGLVIGDNQNRKNVNYYLTPKGKETILSHFNNSIKKNVKSLKNFTEYIQEITEIHLNENKEIWLLGENNDFFKLIISILNKNGVRYFIANSLDDIDFSTDIVVFYWDVDYEDQVKAHPDINFENLARIRKVI